VRTNFGVDIGVVWETAREKLPPIREAVQRVIEEIESTDRGGDAS